MSDGALEILIMVIMECALERKMNDISKTATNIIYTLIKEGKVLAEASKANDRMTICEGCEFLKKDFYQCEKCKCFMKVKTKLDAARCPIDKW